MNSRRLLPTSSKAKHRIFVKGGFPRPDGRGVMCLGYITCRRGIPWLDSGDTDCDRNSATSISFRLCQISFRYAASMASKKENDYSQKVVKDARKFYVSEYACF